MSWLRQCAGWLAHLDADSCPPAVNLRPSADWPDRAIVAVDLARVAAVIDRIAADVDELARARRVQDLDPLPRPRNWSAPGMPGGRAIPARRDQPTAWLHRQPVPATLTTTPCHRSSSGNWTPWRC